MDIIPQLLVGWDGASLSLLSVSLFAAYWSLVIVYRRYFHPLSNIPGPWLATTQLYQYYYDSILGGRFYHEMERLHKIYGPVLRIGPNEVHLCDPDNYDKIYSMTTKFYKDPLFYNIFGNPESHFAMISNDMHRKQRAVLSPFFSKRSVVNQEGIVQEKAFKLCDRLSQAFRALSLDVISEYGFGKEHAYEFLDAPDLGRWWSDMILGLSYAVPFMLLVPWLVAPMQSLPDWLSVRINPVIRDTVECQMVCGEAVDKATKEIRDGIQPEKKTIFHDLISAGERGELRGIKVTRKYLVDEAFSILAAASETLGNALTIGTYHIIQNPEIYAKLRKELRDRFADWRDMPCSELEKLPYLTAVIKEALRIGYGIIRPLPRVTPAGGASFNGYYIPEGTTVGMSCWFLHRHPSAFPDPDKFDPERWLGDKVEVRRLEKYMVPFSRGSRGCIGQNLAWAELYVTFGRLFHRFDDLITNVTPEDMIYESYFAIFHPIKAKRFMVKRSRKEREVVA